MFIPLLFVNIAYWG